MSAYDNDTTAMGVALEHATSELRAARSRIAQLESQLRDSVQQLEALRIELAEEKRQHMLAVAALDGAFV